MNQTKRTKPLGRKNYGSIPHLIGSKVGEHDKYINQGQHNILTKKTRDKHDFVIVTEKYDGTNVGIAKLNGNIISLTRSGYQAKESQFEQHHHFAQWVENRESMFCDILKEGERICGEWLAMVSSIKYDLFHLHPFVAFDMIDVNNERIIQEKWRPILMDYMFTSRVIHSGFESYPLEMAIYNLFAPSLDHIKSIDKPEGIVYQIERKGKVDFLAKYVRSDFEPGKHLPFKSGREPIWNVNQYYLNQLYK